MKTRTHASAVLLMLLAPVPGVANADPPIPEPDRSLPRAVQLVDAHFRKSFPDEKRFAESEDLKVEDFFVTKAEYTHTFGEKELKEWSWIVTFRHPVHNDNSFTFKLDTKAKVTLLQQTE